MGIYIERNNITDKLERMRNNLYNTKCQVALIYESISKLVQY